MLDRCVAHTIKLFCQSRGLVSFEEVADTQGAGASGGIVGVFLAIFGTRAKVISGLEFIA